ncbi:MAG: ABC transporter substrate-binding protein [Nitrososphaeraceae archaeon]|nr:ABC transporter substrate-binding protein [Nitrososphaeraceae archaeon]
MTIYYHILLITVLFFIAPGSSVIHASENDVALENDTSKTLVISNSNLSEPIAQQSSKINVVASFFPIYEFAKQVGGDRVNIMTLIPAGVEPHDYEPTIQQLQEAENADVVFFNGLGFEDSWIGRINNDNLVDTSALLNLSQGSKIRNPHVWLDPVLAKAQVQQVENALIEIDPNIKLYYQNNVMNFTAELDALDSEIRIVLQACNKKDFIAFHDAFGYFANRYGLIQHSVQGISPEGEVLPQRIEQTIRLADDLGLNVIYAEELVDPRFAEVIAQEIPNGKVLVLSPLEGIEKEEMDTGIGYLDKMEQNISNLKVGLECSI